MIVALGSESSARVSSLGARGRYGAGTRITRPVPGTRPSGSSLRDFMQNRSLCRDVQVSWSTWMCGNDPDDFVERVRIVPKQT